MGSLREAFLEQRRQQLTFIKQLEQLVEKSLDPVRIRLFRHCFAQTTYVSIEGRFHLNLLRGATVLDVLILGTPLQLTELLSP